MPAPQTFGQRVLANLKKRWIQVFLSLLALCGAVYAAQRVLGPKEAKAGPKDAAVYKYLTCSECKFEMSYNPEQENKTCPKCKPPTVGYLTAAKESIKKGGDGSPWRRYNIAVAVAAVVWLAVVYLLLSRPVAAAPTEFVVNCLHCGLALRYKPDGCDQYALCPGCEQVVKLPDADEAMTQDDQNDAKETALLTAIEQDLRDSGTIVDADPEEGEAADAAAKG